MSGVALPVALTPLLGRDADVPTLRTWLGDPAVRLVTLTGPGGVGKTRVALEVAQTLAADGVTRVVFVPLAAVREPAFVASAIAEGVGLADVAVRDLESYRGALGWLIERGRPSEAIDIAWALLFFWLIRGHAAEGLRWYEQIVHLPSRTPAAESRALAGAGIMLYAQGDLQRARAELERARTSAAGCGEMEMVAQAELMLGYVELGGGNIDAARNWVTRGDERFRSFALPWGTGQALNGLAWVAVATGDLDRAERLLDDAVTALRDVGPWFLCLPRYLRALVAIRRGRPDDAIAWVRDTFTDLRGLHDRFAFVYSLVPLAAAAALEGDHESVARIIGARDAITESTGATVVDRSNRTLQEHAAREARARLGTERWAVAYAAGRKSSVDALLKDIQNVARRRAVEREAAE